VVGVATQILKPSIVQIFLTQTAERYQLQTSDFSCNAPFAGNYGLRMLQSTWLGLTAINSLGHDGNVTLIGDLRKRDWAFPLHEDFETGRAFVFLNTMERRVDGSDVFGPNGLLGLRAIVLSYDYDRHDTAELGLAFKLRDPRTYNGVAPDIAKCGFTVMRLGLVGKLSITVQTHLPPSPDADYLKRVLNLVKTPTNVHPEKSLDHALGLAGASEHILNPRIPLATYLQRLAAPRPIPNQPSTM
jgi:hypothetical protein